MTPLPLRTVALASALAATSLAVATPASAAHGTPGREFTQVQMNLCLSGYAGCYGGTHYPKVLDEAVSVIKQHHPDAVTINEACSGDAQEIADRTGYKVEFSTVIYGGAPLACKNPGDRGVFGNAILTRVLVKDVQQAAYSGQEGKEERRWRCVETVQGVTVCASHLAVSRSVAAQEAQCRELEGLLAERAAQGPTYFGGDVNRRTDCAPESMWVTTDAGATQAPGIQHIYGSKDTNLISSHWQQATYTDHPFLITTSVVPPKGHR